MALISSTGVINAIKMDEQAADPATPATGDWKVYFKAAGLFHIDDAGVVVGPLGTVGGGGVSDGDKGDITVSASGATWTIDNTVVSNAKLATVANATIKGRTTAGTGAPEDLTATQATALLNAVVGDSGSGGTKGLAPAPAAGDAAAAKFLKADGTWAVPAGGGGVTDGDKGDITVTASGATWTIDNTVVSNAKLATVATATIKGRTTAGTGAPEDLTATQATALLNAVVGDSGSGGTKGLAPAPAAGDAAAAKFLKADGTWAVPAGGSGAPGGSNTQIQYNVNGTSFGGIPGFTFDSTTFALTYSPGVISGTAGAYSVTAASGAASVPGGAVTITGGAAGSNAAAGAVTISGGTGNVGAGGDVTLAAGPAGGGGVAGNLVLRTNGTERLRVTRLGAWSVGSSTTDYGSSGQVLTSAGSASPPTWATPAGGVTDGDKGDITVTASGATWTIDSTVVSNAKLATVATATIKGRTTAGTGAPEDLTATQATALLNAVVGDSGSGGTKGLAPAPAAGDAAAAKFLKADGTWAVPAGGGGVTDGDKGDITVTASGATWTIDNTVVSNAKLATVATATIKGRTTAGTGAPEDLTATQATALLNAVVGDSGSGGTKGLAPAPAAGDTAAGKFLKADGTWAVPAGSAIINTPAGGIAAATVQAAINELDTEKLTSPLTTKGDILAFSTVNARLAVGATKGQVLSADSGEATGLKWAGATAMRAINTAGQTVTNDAVTKVQLPTKSFDTDNAFDNSTNYRFTPTRAGYYQLSAFLYATAAVLSYLSISFHKNGASYGLAGFSGPYASGAGSGAVSVSDIMFLNGTDYVEMFTQIGGSGTCAVGGSVNPPVFSAVWVGA